MTSPSPACSSGPTPPPPPCSSRPDARSTTTAALNPRALLSDAQFNAVLHTILDDNIDMDSEIGSRVLTQALAFLAVASRSATPMVPSRVVDAGWHALILHTALYADLCGRLGGFVHHYPERPDPSRFDQGALDRTIAAIEAGGYLVDRELWVAGPDPRFGVAASCGQHSDDGGTIVITPKPNG